MLSLTDQFFFSVRSPALVVDELGRKCRGNTIMEGEWVCGFLPNQRHFHSNLWCSPEAHAVRIHFRDFLKQSYLFKTYLWALNSEGTFCNTPTTLAREVYPHLYKDNFAHVNSFWRRSYHERTQAMYRELIWHTYRLRQSVKLQNIFQQVSETWWNFRWLYVSFRQNQ